MLNRFQKKIQEQQSAEIEQAPERAPLRTFKEGSVADGVLEPGPSLKFRKLRRRLLQILFLFLIVVAASAFYYAVSSPDESEASMPARQALPVGEDINPAQFFQTFIRYNFGKKPPEALNTIKASGIIERDGVQQEFVLYKKQPGMALLVLIFEGGSKVTFGMDGEDVWQKIEAQNGATRVNIVEEEFTQQLKLMGQFYTPFIQYALNFNNLDPALEIDDQREQSGIIEVSFTNPFNGEQALAKIDAATFHLLETRNAKKGGQTIFYVYDNYESVDGLQVPKKVDYRLNGKVVQSIRLDEASTNIGILSELFKVPAELEDSSPVL